MHETEIAICARLAAIRRKHFGERGKARFARALGIRPTTYQHYEIDRSPPVEVLIEAANATGASLNWLIRGEGPMEHRPTAGAAESDPLIDRVRALVAARPEAAQSVERFVELLERVATTLPRPAERSRSPLDTAEFLPVVGSTAAGRARFWQEIEPAEAESGALNQRMQELLSQHFARSVRVGEMSPAGMESTEVASLVQLSRPDELGFVEFLSCRAVKEKHPRAVAWRIDGDSMSPRYEDGDFVIVSPDEPAVDGYPCVAHQRGQIGVNCKIFSHSGDDVILIPVNESSHLQRVQAGEIVWAFRVLYSVRLAEQPPA